MRGGRYNVLFGSDRLGEKLMLLWLYQLLICHALWGGEGGGRGHVGRGGCGLDHGGWVV